MNYIPTLEELTELVEGGWIRGDEQTKTITNLISRIHELHEETDRLRNALNNYKATPDLSDENAALKLQLVIAKNDLEEMRKSYVPKSELEELDDDRIEAIARAERAEAEACDLRAQLTREEYRRFKEQQDRDAAIAEVERLTKERDEARRQRDFATRDRTAEARYIEETNAKIFGEQRAKMLALVDELRILRAAAERVVELWGVRNHVSADQAMDALRTALSQPKPERNGW